MKTKKMKTALCGLTAVLAIACTPDNGGSKKATTANQVPASLSFQKPAVGAALTKDQVEEMKKFFAGKPP